MHFVSQLPASKIKKRVKLKFEVRLSIGIPNVAFTGSLSRRAPKKKEQKFLRQMQDEDMQSQHDK